jgi:hypothetical protein
MTYINQNLQIVDLKADFPSTSFPRGFEVAQVNDTTTIYKVFPARVQPTESQIGTPNGYEIHEGRAYHVLTIRDKTIAERTETLIPHLENYRYTKEIGGFLFNGLLIPTDEKTERRIIGARVKAEANPNYVIADWTTDNGVTTYTLDAATIIGISDAFDQHVQKCFSAMVTVRQNINQYTTTAEVETAFNEAYDG